MEELLDELVKGDTDDGILLNQSVSCLAMVLKGRW